MNALRSIFLRREAGILVMIVLFCAVVGLYKPQFLTGQSLRIVLLLTPLIMIGVLHLRSKKLMTKSFLTPRTVLPIPRSFSRPFATLK